MRTESLYAAALLFAGSQAASGVYDRPLDIVYVREGGVSLPYSNDQILGYLDQVKPAVTSVIPFFLNVASPSKYESIITAMQHRNITLVPAVGGSPGDGDLDSPNYKAIAKGYKAYTNYIRLENQQGFYDMYGQNGIQNMINYCVSLGFKHIMLNPWPQEKGGAIVPFKNPELDASIYQVLLDQNKQTNEPIANASNWYPGNQNKIHAVRAYRPDIQLLINYESPPQQDVLTNIETKTKGGSIDAFKTTIKEINGEYKSENLHWIPPFDQSYDPIKLNTWNWIAAQLSQM